MIVGFPTPWVPTVGDVLLKDRALRLGEVRLG